MQPTTVYNAVGGMEETDIGAFRLPNPSYLYEQQHKTLDGVMYVCVHEGRERRITPSRPGYSRQLVRIRFLQHSKSTKDANITCDATQQTNVFFVYTP